MSKIVDDYLADKSWLQRRKFYWKVRRLRFNLWLVRLLIKCSQLVCKHFFVDIDTRRCTHCGKRLND